MKEGEVSELIKKSMKLKPSKKQVWTSPNQKGGWRDHKNNPAGFPSKKDAQEAFNTLIGWCVGQGLKEGNYSTIWLLIRIAKYIDKLRK